MKLNQLKSLLKHIIAEAIKSGIKPVAENLAPNRDYNDPRIVAHSIYQPVYLTTFSHNESDGSKVYDVLLHSATGPKHAIKQDSKGKWFYLRDHDRKWISADPYITVPKVGEKVPGQPEKPKGALGHLDIGPLQEMIANKDVPPDVMGAVNVEEEFDDEKEEIFKNGDKVKLKPEWAGREAREIFTLSQWNGRRGWIADKDGRGWYAKGHQIMHVDDVEEQSVSGGAGAYSTPFAFKKKIREIGSFEAKVKARIGGVVNKAKTLKNEKILPDGRYADDMWDGGRMKRATGMNEIHNLVGVPTQIGDFVKVSDGSGVDSGRTGKIIKTKFKNTPGGMIPDESGAYKPQSKGWLSVQFDDGHVASFPPNRLQPTSPLKEDTSSGAVFSGGPTIQTPAWGTKNRLGSPRAIKASKSLGMKVVKSITDEE